MLGTAGTLGAGIVTALALLGGAWTPFAGECGGIAPGMSEVTSCSLGQHAFTQSLAYALHPDAAFTQGTVVVQFSPGPGHEDFVYYCYYFPGAAPDCDVHGLAPEPFIVYDVSCSEISSTRASWSCSVSTT